jgi:tetrahydromethanopterin S-methyltransferase subunit E
MTQLSPQAQEVFWAFNRAASGKPDDWHYLPAIAAAIRTAADQVVPEEESPADFLDHPVAAEIDQRRATRAHLLAIADELEAQ